MAITIRSLRYQRTPMGFVVKLSIIYMNVTSFLYKKGVTAMPIAVHMRNGISNDFTLPSNFFLYSLKPKLSMLKKNRYPDKMNSIGTAG